MNANYYERMEAQAYERGLNDGRLEAAALQAAAEAERDALRAEAAALRAVVTAAAEQLCLHGPKEHDEPGNPCGDEECVGCIARAALAPPAKAEGE